MRREAGGGFRMRRGTHVYLWLIHVDVWQKPSQYCKAIILQLKQINFKIKIIKNKQKKKVLWLVPQCIPALSTTLYVSKVKVAQSCPTLCNPMDCKVHGILPARTLEWVAFPFSRESFQPRDRTQVSHTAGRFFTS